MPLPITFDWSEDENTIYFVLHVRGVKAKNVDIALCDVYIKVNCHPQFFEADLVHEIDPEDPKTRCRVGTDKVSLSLRKKEPALWHSFRAAGTKAELRARRQRALDAAQERESKRQEDRAEWKQKMLKAGEQEQWRLDQQNREQIEKWEQEEKASWEKEVYEAFDEETKAAVGPETLPAREEEDLHGPGEEEVREVPSSQASSFAPGPRPEEEAQSVREVSEEEAVQIRAEKAQAAQQQQGSVTEQAAKGKDGQEIWTDKDLDDTEEYVPSVRENPGKVGIRFTERPRPGVPVRDRGQRPPPLPKEKVPNAAPPMLEGDEPADESDPVWLKDKADSLMVVGDYSGAYNAYTEALKIASNAKAFANRAVAALYLGNIEQCVEDCNHSLNILDMRKRTKDGFCPGPSDPQDEALRARVEVRVGTAYLWLGAFSKAEAHFSKALDVEDGLDLEERRKIKEDLERVKSAKAALGAKEAADGAARRAPGGGHEILTEALRLYEEAMEKDSESAVLLANRSFAHLRSGNLQECLADSDAALRCLRMWPAARHPPKEPARPSRLDPPYIDDPTFKHLDQQKQGEVDWLMKHSGGSSKDLPPLPLEYEWVKDAAEKNDNSWIAIRKKMPKATIDAIRRATVQLQDVLYTRKPFLIRQQVEVAIEQNKAGEGPSAKAIHQSQEYADKLEEHEKEKQLEFEKQDADLQQEFEECRLEEELAPVRSGVAKAGFGHGHPTECTRRRLFVKVLLRRSRALELLGQVEAATAELRTVLRVEPENPEAKQRLAVLEATLSSSQEPQPLDTSAQQHAVSFPPSTSVVAEASAAVPSAEPRPSTTPEPTAPARDGAIAKSPSKAQAKAVSSSLDSLDDDDDDDAAGNEVDHAATATLLKSATEYMKRNDYASALQIYNYARKTCKAWESPLDELKVLSNTSLCLQRIRGRLPELISACSEAVSRIVSMREEGTSGVSEELLLRMECACLSRRGSAYAQQKQIEESNRDAARVKELLARVGELEAMSRPAPAG